MKVIIIVVAGFFYKAMTPKSMGKEKITKGKKMNGEQGEHSMFNAFIVFGVFFIVWALGFFLKRFTLHDGFKAVAIFLLAIISFFVGEYFRSRES